MGRVLPWEKGLVGTLSVFHDGARGGGGGQASVKAARQAPRQGVHSDHHILALRVPVHAHADAVEMLAREGPEAIPHRLVHVMVRETKEARHAETLEVEEYFIDMSFAIVFCNIIVM